MDLNGIGGTTPPRDHDDILGDSRHAAFAVERARLAGITAVWTGDCSATVELARLRGPRDGLVTHASPTCAITTVPAPWQLSTSAVRVALYRCCLITGTQFDIYRWVNLIDLAAVFDRLSLPSGVGHMWHAALAAAGLVAHAPLPAEPSGRTFVSGSTATRRTAAPAGRRHRGRGPGRTAAGEAELIRAL